MPGYRPLVAAHMRRPALVVIAVAVVLTAVLALRYAGDNDPSRIDAALDGLAARALHNEFFDSVDAYFIKLGDPKWLLLLVLGVAALAALARRWPAMLLVVLAAVVAVGLVKLVLKPLVGRHIGEVLSFPSTHVTGTATVAVAVAVILLTARWPRRLWLRIAASFLPLAVAAIVTLAVVAERTHYTTDTAAAWCVAIAVVLSTALVIDTVILSVKTETHEWSENVQRNE